MQEIDYLEQNNSKRVGIKLSLNFIPTLLQFILIFNKIIQNIEYKILLQLEIEIDRNI